MADNAVPSPKPSRTAALVALGCLLLSLLCALYLNRFSVWGYFALGRAKYVGSFEMKGANDQKYFVALYVEPTSIPGSQTAIACFTKLGTLTYRESVFSLGYRLFYRSYSIVPGAQGEILEASLITDDGDRFFEKYSIDKDGFIFLEHGRVP